MSGFIVEDEAEAIQAVRDCGSWIGARSGHHSSAASLHPKWPGSISTVIKEILAEVRRDHSTFTNIPAEQVEAWGAPHIVYMSHNLPATGTAPIRELNPNGHTATHVVNDDLDVIDRGANMREAAKRPRPDDYAGDLRKNR